MTPVQQRKFNTLRPFVAPENIHNYTPEQHQAIGQMVKGLNDATAITQVNFHLEKGLLWDTFSANMTTEDGQQHEIKGNGIDRFVKQITQFLQNLNN